MPIIKCEDIKKYFKRRAGIIKAVDGVSFEIERGDTFGIVGESGCGKTTLGRILLGALKQDSGSVVSNSYRAQAIFQDPYSSLDPKMKLYDILAEGLIIRGTGQIKKSVEETLDLIKLPTEALKKYPHQFSGGERQRIAIGRAVITKPDFIVCDEPVSSLDVRSGLNILKLLQDIQKVFSVAYLFISHDLKIIKFMCNKLAVMKCGRFVESGAVKDIYAGPKHDYTKALLSSVFCDNIKK